LERVYDGAHQAGECYLVERLWPRGIRKGDLDVEDWLRDVAPSTGLRRWFAHDADKWDEFRRRYFAELDEHEDAWQPLAAAMRRGPIVLLFSARDTERNSAVALRDYLLEHVRSRTSQRSA
jgi:uncharacterized protein YeaO (DUF488 family)